MARTEAYYRRLRKSREWLREDRLRNPEKYRRARSLRRRAKGPDAPKEQFTEEGYIQRERNVATGKKGIRGMGWEELRDKYNNYSKLSPEEQAERRDKISIGLQRYFNRLRKELSPEEFKDKHALMTLHLRQAAAAFRASNGKGPQKWAWMDPAFKKYLSELGKERMKNPEYKEWQRQRILAGWRAKKRVKPSAWVLKLRKIKRREYIKNWKMRRNK